MPRELGSEPFSLAPSRGAPFPVSGRCGRRSRGCMSGRDPSPIRRDPSGPRDPSCPSGRGRCDCSGAGDRCACSGGGEGGSAVPEGLPSVPGRVSVSLRMRRRRSRRGRRSMNSSNILGSILFSFGGPSAFLRRAHPLFFGGEMAHLRRAALLGRRHERPDAWSISGAGLRAAWRRFNQGAWSAAPPARPERQDLGSTGPESLEDEVQGSVVSKTRPPPSLSAAARDPLRMHLETALRPAIPCAMAPVRFPFLPWGRPENSLSGQGTTASTSAAWVCTFTFSNACRILPSGPIT
jgi:hypothetical protein